MTGSRGRRRGSRLWELIRAGKLRGLPYLRIGRTYRFNLAEVEGWWVPSRFAAYSAFQKHCEAASIGPHRFHDLRHTYASYAAMAGVGLHVIAETMGHGHVTITKRYAHLSPQYKRRELEKMAGFLVRPDAAREPHASYNAASGKER